MKILVLNVKGVGKLSFFSTYRILVDQYLPDVCILLETLLLGKGLDRARRKPFCLIGFFFY